jgi:hypothetical protein
MFERWLEAITGALRAPVLEVIADCVRLDQAHVHVHVRGTALGVLRCGDYWSFRVGQFSTSLLVPASERSSEIILYGLAGIARRTLPLHATHQLPLLAAAHARTQRLRVRPRIGVPVVLSTRVRLQRLDCAPTEPRFRVALARLRPTARF